MLQKTLSVRGRASARELCLQYGCARIEASIRSTLATFKERFLQTLPLADREKADLSDHRYLAAVFSLVARKNKVKVAREKLLSGLGLTSKELNQTLAVVIEMVPDLVDSTKEKKKCGNAAEKKRKSEGETKEGHNVEEGNGVRECTEKGMH